MMERNSDLKLKSLNNFLKIKAGIKEK